MFKTNVCLKLLSRLSVNDRWTTHTGAESAHKILSKSVSPIHNKTLKSLYQRGKVRSDLIQSVAIYRW